MRETGSVVADRYVLEDLIGEGGMASVWAATHNVTGRAVALKFLSRDRSNLEEARARFLREARAASLVQHPNVVPVHDVVTLDDGTLVMVMDRLFGETLRERLDAIGPLSPTEAAALMVPVLSAVGTAHAAGVVHRDLKPENIFITDEGDVKVLDFGIAKLMAAEHQGDLTNTGALLGTPYYMAPEQIFGERDLDARADVWSLGVILYECLTGERPFEGDNAGQIMKAVLVGRYPPATDLVPDLPGDLVELLEAMLTIDRADRSADLTAAFEVLGRYTPTEAVSFGRAVAPRSLVPPPSAPGSRPRIPSARGSAPSRSHVSGDDATLAATELMPSSSETGREDREAARVSLSDTLATAGPQELTFRPESSGLRPLLIAAAAAVLGLVVYLAWPNTAAESPSVAAPPSALPSATAPIAEPPEPPPAPSEPELAVSATVAPEGTVAPPSPRPRPASAPRPPAPPPPPPSALPHGVHGEVPF